MEATHGVVKYVREDMQTIQAGQVGVQQSIESVCDKHTEGLQELAGLMDQKLESATSNLKAEIRTVQELLQNAISENSTRRGIQSKSISTN